METGSFASGSGLRSLGPNRNHPHWAIHGHCWNRPRYCANLGPIRGKRTALGSTQCMQHHTLHPAGVPAESHPAATRRKERSSVLSWAGQPPARGPGHPAASAKDAGRPALAGCPGSASRSPPFRRRPPSPGRPPPPACCSLRPAQRVQPTTDVGIGARSCRPLRWVGSSGFAIRSASGLGFGLGLGVVRSSCNRP